MFLEKVILFLILFIAYINSENYMKKNIHPNYAKMNVTCSCGHSISLYSTLCKDINIDVCSNCHPFYTGQQRISDIGGRVEKFNKKFKIN